VVTVPIWFPTILLVLSVGTAGFAAFLWHENTERTAEIRNVRVGVTELVIRLEKAEKSVKAAHSQIDSIKAGSL
jgi:Flp pilus assembly protein TadB